MPLRRKPSGSGLLYLILDKEVVEKANKDIFSLADKSSIYGVDIFQLRAKDTCDKDLLKIAAKLRKIIHKRKKVFIVNDRVDIAYLSGADGLHLGASDISSSAARKILQKKAVIGKTVHSLNELLLFKKERVNYIGVGPVFRTKTKPSLPPLATGELITILEQTPKLTFAIGGINLYNIHSLAAKRINNIAVCRGIILSKDLKNTVRRFKECLKKAC